MIPDLDHICTLEEYNFHGFHSQLGICILEISSLKFYWKVCLVSNEEQDTYGWLLTLDTHASEDGKL